MKKTYHLLILISILVFSFFIYSKFKSTKSFIEKLKNENTVFSQRIIGELINHSDFFPKTKDDLKIILSNIDNLSDNQFTFFTKGYGVKYDSINRSTRIYSYSVNDTDNYNQKKNYLNDIDIFSFKYYLKSIGSDIVIFEILEDQWNYDFCNIKNKDDLKNKMYLSQFSNIYKVYYKGNLIKENLVKQFKNTVKNIQLKINDSSLKDKILENKIVFFRLKNNKISIVCDNNIAKQLLEKYRLEIENYFLSMDKFYFDYAVFPIAF